MALYYAPFKFTQQRRMARGDTTVIKTFADLDLDPNLLTAIEEMGYSRPTQIQAQALTRQQAQSQAIASIRSLRYDDTNYFWINNYQPAMVMHPIKPALEGKDLTNNKDPDGTPLFVEMVSVVKQSGEGYVPYKWPKQSNL